MPDVHKGILYPIEKTPYGLFHTGSNVAQIKASMLTIIMTKPGERVMRPYFGTPLYKLRSRPWEVIAEEARQMIAYSLKRFEKRAQVTDVQCVLLNDGCLNIQVLFIDPTNLQETQELVLQIQLLS
jgi:phage baseplate assembly protein W